MVLIRITHNSNLGNLSSNSFSGEFILTDVMYSSDDFPIKRQRNINEKEANNVT